MALVPPVGFELSVLLGLSAALSSFLATFTAVSNLAVVYTTGTGAAISNRSRIVFCVNPAVRRLEARSFVWIEVISLYLA